MQKSSGNWTPRKFMLAAFVIHLFALPFAYSTSSISGSVSSTRPSDRVIYEQTKCAGCANDSQFGRDIKVETLGKPAESGFEAAPYAIVVLPFLLFVFWAFEPKGGFWSRRRGYAVAVFLLLMCGVGEVLNTKGGFINMFALLVAVRALWLRWTEYSDSLGAVESVS